MQRARDGRGRKREHIHALFQLLDGFFVRHAKALLLVDHQQAQILVFHILAQQAVRADDHVDLAFLKVLKHLLLLAGRAEAADGVHMHGEAMEAVHHRGVVLLYQDGGRREQGCLLATHHSLEDRAQGHLRFAIAHIAAQQAIHHLV